MDYPQTSGWSPVHPSVLLGLLVAFVFAAASGSSEPALARLTFQQTVGANSLTTRSLAAPASLTASTPGHDVALSWPAGLNGNGYAVLGVANGSSNNCTAASFASLASTAGNSYTDTGRFTPQGTWYCYQVQTTYAGWNSTASNPTAAARLGFVATSVQLINNGNSAGCSGVALLGGQVGVAGTLDCGDQLVITFNQPVNTATGPIAGDTVCGRQSNNTLWLASTTTTGNCGAAEGVNLGSLTGGTLGGCDCRYAATYAWGNGNQTLTMTVGAEMGAVTLNYVTVSTSTWAFTPTTTASKMQAATGAFHICDTNTGGGQCLPATASATTF